MQTDGRQFTGSAFDWITPFNLFCGLSVMVGYALLGAGWINIKTEHALQQRVRKLASPLLAALIAEPDPVYRQQAKQHLSSHALADFRACPLLYRQKQLGLIPESESSAYLLGRAVHCRTLEGEIVFAREFVIGERWARARAKAW